MFKQPFSIILILILALFAAISFLPIVVTKLSWISLNVNKPNEIGDTIGGILGPIVGFLGVVVTFLAFWMQYKANEKQFKKFDEQDEDTKVERFENKFYELLKIHRDNVNEFEIVRNDDKENLKGRRIFVEMFNELEYTYLIVKTISIKLNEDSEPTAYKFSDDDSFNVSYLLFFNGFSDWSILDSEPASLSEFRLLDIKLNPLLINALKFLAHVRTKQAKQLLSQPEIQLTDKLMMFPLPKVTFTLFGGHNSRLGHYYRNLFQIVTFVVNSNIKENDKYSYVKIIRAQLSNHEQLLLYYNSLSPYGQPWLDNHYFNDWRMIKNIPIDMAHFYKTPRELFEKKNKYGKYIFEVDEIASRMKKI